jgi:hypothetical protein
MTKLGPSESSTSDEIGNRRALLEAHPSHAEFAFLVTHDKVFQVFQVSRTLFVTALESRPVASLPETQLGGAEWNFPRTVFEAKLAIKSS